MRGIRSTVSMLTNSTTLLTLLWFTSCTSLVTKHTKLVYVFFSLCGSFCLAIPVQMMLRVTTTARATTSLRATRRKPKPRCKDTTTGRRHHANDDRCSDKNIDLNNRTKNMVGLCACIMSLTYLLQHNVMDNSTPRFENIDYSALSSLFISSPYLAFSILTGYLTFDLWYTYLAPTSFHLWQIVEDATTLILLLTLLSIFEEDVTQFSAWLAPVLVYRGLRYAAAVCGWWSVPDWFRFRSGTTADSQVPFKKDMPKQEPRPLLLSDIAGAADRHFLQDDINNNSTSNLWMIHGQYYDLKDFVDRHPGGKEAILLGRGRDCTALVESYHPFSQPQVRRILDKYWTPLSANKSKAPKHIEDPFYEILCERVFDALRKKGIDPIRDRGAPVLRIFYYVTVVISVLVAAYAHFKGSILGSFFLAVFGWLLGALGHDAGHFAVSRKYPWINDVGVWGMSFLCNPILWQHQHTYAHHSHTNEFDHDPDLHHFHTLLRVHWKFRARNIYKYQVYWPFVMLAYALVVFGTCLWIPLGVIQSGSLYGIVEWTDRKRVWRSLSLLLHTFGYVVFIIVSPFWTHSNWWSAASAVTVHVAVAGILFGIFSQINHLNEPSLRFATENRQDQQAAKRNPIVTNSWAAAQVETSNNFCPDSSIWHVVSNGLNLQIEHHLFPGINHSHLHHIAPVVRRTCADYGVVYKSYNSWSSLMHATLEWLKTLSKESYDEVSAIQQFG